jgi:hypothetical protein
LNVTKPPVPASLLQNRCMSSKKALSFSVTVNEAQSDCAAQLLKARGVAKRWPTLGEFFPQRPTAVVRLRQLGGHGRHRTQAVRVGHRIVLHKDQITVFDLHDLGLPLQRAVHRDHLELAFHVLVVDVGHRQPCHRHGSKRRRPESRCHHQRSRPCVLKSSYLPVRAHCTFRCNLGAVKTAVGAVDNTSVGVVCAVPAAWRVRPSHRPPPDQGWHQC